MEEKPCLHVFKNIPVLHCHSDTFDPPKNCFHLASSEITKNQVFLYEKLYFGNTILLRSTH